MSRESKREPSQSQPKASGCRLFGTERASNDWGDGRGQRSWGGRIPISGVQAGSGFVKTIGERVLRMIWNAC